MAEQTEQDVSPWQAYAHQLTVTQAAQQVGRDDRDYWIRHGRQKRGPPSPVESAASTPLGQPATSSTTPPPYVTPVTLEEKTAAQTVAGHLGAEVNTEEGMQQWLTTPLSTQGEVFKLIHTYHVKVVRPEVYGMVAQLETALSNLNDKLFSCRQELNFMIADNRSAQRHASGMMLVTTGWPPMLGPKERVYQLGWMISQVPEAVQFLEHRGLKAKGVDHISLDSEYWFNILQVDPMTVPQGDHWSGMTLLTFKSWDLRNGFLKKFGETSGTPFWLKDGSPQTGKHIRVSPCTPQWQRKLESPIRVVLACLNKHKDTQGKQVVILWKSLTVMSPKEDRDFQPDHTAFCRLFYEEYEGEFRGRLEITPELLAILNSPPSEVGSKDQTLWQEQWNQIQWGTQWEFDEAERQIYTAARATAVHYGKGTMAGKGRKHWSAALIHNSWYSPYPFSLDLKQVEEVAFVWDEFCTKQGKEDQCVGDMRAATFRGKPVLPKAIAAGGEDVDMEAEAPAPKSPSPALPTVTPAKAKGAGHK